MEESDIIMIDCLVFNSKYPRKIEIHPPYLVLNFGSDLFKNEAE